MTHPAYDDLAARVAAPMLAKYGTVVTLLWVRIVGAVVDKAISTPTDRWIHTELGQVKRVGVGITNVREERNGDGIDVPAKALCLGHLSGSPGLTSRGAGTCR